MCRRSPCFCFSGRGGRRRLSSPERHRQQRQERLVAHVAVNNVKARRGRNRVELDRRPLDAQQLWRGQRTLGVFLQSVARVSA